MMQDLIVEDVARELIFLGETVLQVRTRQHWNAKLPSHFLFETDLGKKESVISYECCKNFVSFPITGINVQMCPISRPFSIRAGDQLSSVLCYNLRVRGNTTSSHCVAMVYNMLLSTCAILLKPFYQLPIFVCDFPFQQLPDPSPLRDYVLSRSVRVQYLHDPALGRH